MRTLDLDFRGVLDGLGDAVVAADSDNRIIYANRAAERLLAWGDGELIGQPLTAIQPASMRSAHLAGLRRYLETGERTLLGAGPVRVPAMRRDGGQLYVELSLSAHRLPDGEEVFIGVLRDLSERIELQRQRSLSDDLRTATRVVAGLGTQENPEETAETVTRAMVEQFRAESAQFWRRASTGWHRLAATDASPPMSMASQAQPVPTVVREAARRRQTVVDNGQRTDGLTSVALPLLAGRAVQGVVVCGYREQPPEELREVLSTFGSLVGAHLAEVSALVRERAARMDTESALRRSRFLQHAGRLLGAANLDKSLSRLARLAIPDMGDWCTVDLLDAEGGLRRVGAAHVDPRREELLRRLARRRPENAEGSLGPARVSVTGESQLLAEINDEFLADAAWDSDHLEMLRRLAPSSLACVPLRARGRILGTLTFASSDPSRTYGADDLQLLETLARDAAFAVDNARLIEELRVANRSSHESLALLDSLFSNAPVGLAVLDTDLRYVRINDALADISGIRADEHIGRTSSELLGQLGERADDLRRQVLKTGEATRGIALSGTIGNDSQVRHWLVNYFPVVSLDGEIYGVGAIVLDMSDRRRAEQELEYERRFFEVVLHNLSDGIVACDTAGRFTVFNEATERMHGASAADVPPDRWPEYYNLFHADGVTRMQPGEVPLRRALEGEDVRDVEMVIAPKRGSRRVVQCNGQAIHDARDRKIGAVVAMHDVTDRKKAEAQLTRQALHDPLTALPNRLLLLDRMRQALARAPRQSGSVAALFLDLDRFKIINDSLGHEVGDQLLRAVARRLKAIMRPSDTVARIGGDEFVVLCEGLSGIDEALSVCQRIEDAVAAPGLLSDVATDVIVSTSVGVAIARGDERAEELIRNADAAMYRAKERGKSRHEVFDDTFRAQAINRLHVETALRRALDSERLRLLYQPIADLDTGRIVGAEALIRYEDPELGLISPSEFLDVAEDSGLIVPIGNWVVVEACRQARIWQERCGDLQFRVSVNLSARQMADVGLVDTLERALRHEGLPRGTVALEITESVLMEAAGSTLRVLDRLKEAGSQLGIDDFGTGYSSLTYLRRFPVDFVKIDQSFVSGLGSDPEDTAIVTAVVGLGKSLGLVTVAEGVETAGQVAILRRLDCDLAQGYHFSRPIPAERLTGMLETAGA